MIVNYSYKIKIAIFQSVSERQGDEWRSSSNCGRIAAKITRFNSVNSEIIGLKPTKFVHDVPGLLPFNFWKQLHDCRIRCQTLEQTLKVVLSGFCKQQQPPNLTGCHSNVLGRPNVRIIIPTHMPTKRAKLVKIGPGYSQIYGAWYADFCRIAAKVVIFNIVYTLACYWTKSCQISIQYKEIHAIYHFDIVIAILQYPFFNTSATNEDRQITDFSSKICCHGNVRDHKVIPGYQTLLYAYQSWNFGKDQSIRFWDTGSSKSIINFFNKKKILAKYRHSHSGKFSERAKWYQVNWRLTHPAFK